MEKDYGLAIRNFVGPKENPNIDEIIRYSERAEELGFESLWVFDHLLLGVDPAFPILDSLSTLTAIATRTKKIMLGTGILVLPLRNPVWAAKIMASLDQISKGRFILGAASGWYKREFDAAGVDFKTRGTTFERNLDLILKLWTGKPITYEGFGLNLREAVIAPRPFQDPHPPVLIGGYVDKVLRRVARISDGWLTYAYTVEAFNESWNKIKNFAREFGRDPSELNATNQVFVYVGKPREEMYAEVHKWLVSEWDYADWSKSTPDQAVIGTVEEVVAQLKPFAESELDRIVFIPYRYETEQVDLLANEVIPALQG